MIFAPNIFREAMGLLAATQWKTASDKDMESLRSNNALKLVPTTVIPADVKAIGSQWVYVVKANSS